MDARHKPVIGLNMDFRSGHNSPHSFSYIASAYLEAILHAGGIPLLFPPLAPDDLEQALGMVQGFILTGGADLDCRRDGWLIHESMRVMETHREDFDRRLVAALDRHSIPTLAIGAGMQLVNVYMGGTLMLDIAEDRPQALPHREADDPDYCHIIHIEEGSFVKSIFLESDTPRVNSLHHQAIDDVAHGLWVTARSIDGIIEAVESTLPDWFVLGVQFHPELPSCRLFGSMFFERLVATAIDPNLRWKYTPNPGGREDEPCTQTLPCGKPTRPAEATPIETPSLISTGRGSRPR